MPHDVLENRRQRLRAGGVEVLLEIPAVGLPRVLHWGADLGVVSDSELEHLVLASVPQVTSYVLRRSGAGRRPAGARPRMGRDCPACAGIATTAATGRRCSRRSPCAGRTGPARRGWSSTRWTTCLARGRRSSWRCCPPAWSGPRAAAQHQPGRRLLGGVGDRRPCRCHRWRTSCWTSTGRHTARTLAPAAAVQRRNPAAGQPPRSRRPRRLPAVIAGSERLRFRLR